MPRSSVAISKVFLAGICCVSLLCNNVHAQLLEEEQNDYGNELVWGVNKNTRGGLIGGFIVRFSRPVGNRFFETFGLELSNVKHPSEARFPGIQGQRFIFGKSNYLYAIRLQYGREKLLFEKSSQQGVRINAGLAAGPTFGLVTPYYVQALGNDGITFEPFDADVHVSPDNVVGPGKLFQGLGESEFAPGINTKAYVSFEFGSYQGSVAGAEIGVMLEAYTKEIVIMPALSNKSTFASLYITLFLGSIK